MANGRRVVLVHRAHYFASPALCRILAGRGHDFLLHLPRPGQAEELRALGATVEVAEDVAEHGPGSADTADGCALLVERTLAAFGRLDAASLQPTNRSARSFVAGPILDATAQDARDMSGYLETSLALLRAVIPAMTAAGGGDILVFTSGAGIRPAAGSALYGGARAGQHFFLQCAALEHARDNITLNALASKNAVSSDFPAGVHGTAGTLPPGAASDDALAAGDWQAPYRAQVPLGRPGTMAELGWFAAGLLDGRNRFQTGQIFGFTGGWDIG